MKRTAFCASFVVTIAAFGAGQHSIAQADTPDRSRTAGQIKAANSEAEARVLLEQAQRILREARTLTADFTASVEYPTFYRDSLEKGTVTLAKPNQVLIRLDRFRKLDAQTGWLAMGNRWTNASDGETWLTLNEHPDSAQHRKAKAPASAEKLLDSLTAVQGFFSGQGAAWTNLRVAGNRKWEAQTFQVIEGQGTEGGSVQAWVGTDHLLHRVLLQNTVAGKTVRREVALRNIRLNNPIESQTFQVTVPAGSQETQRTASDAELLAVGADAPDFAVQDAAGKTVRLSDLRGQVVVLKFFATWCGSCRQSLPHTQNVVSKFANQGVTGLAVDIWDSTKALQKWQSKEAGKYAALKFAVDPAPQGKDIASTLYHIRSTPTVFVVTREGKIGAMLTGYDGATPELENAVRKQLEATGK